MIKFSGIKKTCRKCGFTAPEEWFVKNTKFVFTREYESRINICPMCQQEERDKRKWENRAVVKARNMIYSHAKKYSMKPTDFALKFGWNVHQMAHDINHCFQNSCSYCGHLFSEMGHGLADLTLDVINPSQAPFYTNVRYVCATCNKSKGNRDAEKFGFHLTQVKARDEFLKHHYIRQLEFELL